MMPEDHDRLVILETQFAEYRDAMENRLTKLNELREAVMSDRDAYLRSDVYRVSQEDFRKRLETVDGNSSARHDSLATEMRQRIESLSKEIFQRMESNYASLTDRIGPVKDAQSRLIGIGLAMMALATVVGVFLGHFWK